MAENQTMSSWDRIRQGVADVENLMDQKQYNLSMVRGRQTLEYMINYLAQSVRLESPDMSTAVDELYNLKVINAQSRENYHNIRSLGNRAAHEGNNSAADAAASYQMLSREVYAFADSYAKAARQIGQMIRSGQTVPTRGETGASAQNYGGARYQGAGSRAADTMSRSAAGAQIGNGQAASRTSGAGAGGTTTRIPRVGSDGGYESGNGIARTSAARSGYTLNTQPEIGLASTRRSSGTSGNGSYSGSRNSGTSGMAGSGSQRASAYGTDQRAAGSRTSAYQGNNQGTNAQGARRSASGAGGRTYSSSGARDYDTSGSRIQSGRSSGGSGARKSNRSSATIAGISPEIILKIMIPIILVILLIAVIKFVTKKSSSDTSETTTVAVETESVAETMQVVTAAPIPVQTTEAQTEPETTQAPVYKYTTTDSLKVRTAPGTDAGVIDVLQPGTEVVYIEQTDDKWSKISYNGTEAYVATEYLKKEQVQ